MIKFSEYIRQILKSIFSSSAAKTFDSSKKFAVLVFVKFGLKIFLLVGDFQNLVIIELSCGVDFTTETKPFFLFQALATGTVCEPTPNATAMRMKKSI